MVTIAEAARDRQPVMAFFCEVLTSPPIRAWSGMFPIELEGRTWRPVGTLGGVSEIRRTSDFEVTSFQVGLAAARSLPDMTYDELVSAMIVERTSDAYDGARVLIHAGFFDYATGTLIGGLVPWAGGIASHVETRFDAGGAAQTLQVESPLAKATKPRAIYLSDADQKRLYPGDRFLEFLSDLAGGARVPWRPVI